MERGGTGTSIVELLDGNNSRTERMPHFEAEVGIYLAARTGLTKSCKPLD
jgi:hypothetical protein